MRKFNSFLVINPFGIGDVVFSTPLLKNLKENFPQANIFYLANRRTAPLIKRHPLVEKVFIYERDEFVTIKKQSRFLWIKRILTFIRDIKKEKIEVSIDLSLNSQFGFFSYLAGIKKRIGLDYKRRGIFLTDKLKVDGFDDKHVADYYLDTLRLLGISPKKYPLEIHPTEEIKAWVNSFLEENNLRDNLIIGIIPFGGEAWGEDAIRKRWPKENFSSLINLLIKRLNAKIFIFVGPKEKKEKEELMGYLEGKDKKECFMFDEIEIEKLVGLLDACGLVVGNDTGPLKIADALGKKTVGIFGPVDEKIYGFYPQESLNKIAIKKDITCRPCYKRFRLSPCNNKYACLLQIKVEEVFSEIKKLLN